MPAMTNTLTLTRPDDWHLHVRDGQALIIFGGEVILMYT